MVNLSQSLLGLYRLAERNVGFDKLQAMSSKRSQSRTPDKPIDRWLMLAGVVVAILIFLLPRSTPAVIGGLILVFLFLLHPLWNLPWIDNSLFRRLICVIVVAVVLTILGFVIAPKVKLNLQLHGIWLMKTRNPKQSEIQMTVTVINTGDTSAFINKMSLEEITPTDTLLGDELIGESRPPGSVELPNLMDQELTPGKTVNALIHFTFPRSFDEQYTLFCQGGPLPQGQWNLTLWDSSGHRWSTSETFAELFSSTGCMKPHAK
jgi:hypothetical protein